MDPTTLVLQIAFYLLFAATLWRYLRTRRPVERAVAAVFSTTAALFTLTIINVVASGLTPVLRPLAVGILMAQPYLVIRLLDMVWRVPRWVSVAAFAAFVATTAMLAMLGSRSLPAIIAVVVYFAVAEFGAAVQFGRLARRRRGSHRFRLTMAGLATACFGASIVIGSIGSATSGGAATAGSVTLISRVLAFVAALGYLAAFAPPRWLTGFAHRAAAFDLAREVVAAPAVDAPARLWERLIGAAESILGAHDVRVIEAETDTERADPATTLTADTRSIPRWPSTVLLPLVVDGRTMATLHGHLDGQPLFLEDDLAIVAQLGSLTVQAVHRSREVQAREETRRVLEAAAATRASEARFRALLEADPNAVIATDATAVVTWATSTSADLFGSTPDGLIGRSLREFIDIPAFDTPSSEVRRIQTTGFRADGTTIPVEVALRSFELDGEPTTLAVVSDSSWREEANALRDRFVGVLSHELRTPITSIYGGAQVLLKRAMELDDETRDELLRGLADESERLLRMVENLLILARVERGASFFEMRPILLQRVLADVVEREQNLWPSATIRLSAEDDLPVVSADEDQIAQIVRNLLANAVKYAGATARIEVAVRHEDPWVSVAVQDDGPGFADDEAEQLFQLYYRSARRAAGPGAGIGLFVCRQLVEAMGGTITAATGPERGATFTFRLRPHVEADADLVAAPVTEPFAATVGAVG